MLAAWPSDSDFFLALLRGKLVALASRADPVPTKLCNSPIAVSIGTLILRANQILTLLGGLRPETAPSRAASRRTLP